MTFFAQGPPRLQRDESRNIKITFAFSLRTINLYNIALILQLDPPPEFIAHRDAMWARLKKEQDDWVAAQENKPIKITLPDGNNVEGEAWKTTPYEVAKGIRYKYFKHMNVYIF